MMNDNNKYIKRLFLAVSVLVPLLVAWLFTVPKSEAGEIKAWVYALPFYNAILNSATAILLVAGFVFAKQKRLVFHKTAMISAFVLGVFFLLFYVVYHANVPSTKFGGEGMIRYIYFFLLITHILLAFVVVPLVIFAVYFGVSGKLEHHRKVVRFTFPVWLYVSLSGVIVYILISPYYLH